MRDWRFERPPGLPQPQPDAEARPFFEALKSGRLVLQCCTACGSLAHPPRTLCAECRSSDFHWQPCSGKGVVYSFVVTHQAVHPALVGFTPMATVEIALAEGPHLASNLLDVPPEEVDIGMAVEVVFEDVGKGIVLPLFRQSRK